MANAAPKERPNLRSLASRLQLPEAQMNYQALHSRSTPPLNLRAEASARPADRPTTVQTRCPSMSTVRTDHRMMASDSRSAADKVQSQPEQAVPVKPDLQGGSAGCGSEP